MFHFLKTAISLLLICGTAISANAIRYFVPKNGAFVRYTPKTSYPSANNLAYELGYDTFLFWSYTPDNSNIIEIGFKDGSCDIDDIIYIVAEDKISALSRTTVSTIIKKINLLREFDPMEYEKSLNLAIENKMITKSYFLNRLKKGLMVADGEGYLDKKYEYRLTFQSDTLSKIENVSPLTNVSKIYRARYPKMYKAMYNTAKKYWEDDDESIYDEINSHTKYWWTLNFDTIDYYSDYFYEYDENKVKALNYTLMAVMDEKTTITTRDIVEITHGEARKSIEKSKKTFKGQPVIVYTFRIADFIFSQQGVLLKATTFGELYLD